MTDTGQTEPEKTDPLADALFSFRGRYSRKRYWLGALGLFVLLILMLVAFAPMMATTGGGRGGIAIILLLSIPFFWFYAKLIVHRLHDFGWSGWWFVLLGPLLIPLPFWMWSESHDIYQRIDPSQQQAIKSYSMFMEFGAYALFLGGFMLLGCLRGTRGPNSFGADPFAPRDGDGTARPTEP